MKYLLVLFVVSSAHSATLVHQDERGNKLYHKQQYTQAGAKYCPVSASGTREYHKPCLEVVLKESGK